MTQTADTADDAMLGIGRAVSLWLKWGAALFAATFVLVLLLAGAEKRASRACSDEAPASAEEPYGLEGPWFFYTCVYQMPDGTTQRVDVRDL